MQPDIKIEFGWSAAFKIAWAIWIVSAFMGMLTFLGFVIATALIGRSLFH